MLAMLANDLGKHALLCALLLQFGGIRIFSVLR